MKPDYWEALSPTESSLGIMREPLCEEEKNGCVMRPVKKRRGGERLPCHIDVLGAKIWAA